MKKFFPLVMACLFISAPTFAGLEHTTFIVQRPDGKFDVTCVDGNVEVKTKAEVMNDKVCTAFSTVTGDWTLTDGGVENGAKMCDLNLSLVRTKDSIFRISALFKPPCNGMRSETQDCRAMSCSMKLDEKFYSFEFPDRSRLNVTRLSDGFQSGYKGDAGAGTPTTGVIPRLRTMAVSGVTNVLQATNDEGATWWPICDDDFTEVEATVACREMGFSLDEFQTEVFVPGSSEFGLDDVQCGGSEASLFDCAHSPWRSHNCGSGEHIQLLCKP